MAQLIANKKNLAIGSIVGGWWKTDLLPARKGQNSALNKKIVGEANVSGVNC